MILQAAEDSNREQRELSERVHKNCIKREDLEAVVETIRGKLYEEQSVEATDAYNIALSLLNNLLKK